MNGRAYEGQKGWTTHCASHPAKSASRRFRLRNHNMGNTNTHCSAKTPVPKGQSPAVLQPPRPPRQKPKQATAAKRESDANITGMGQHSLSEKMNKCTATEKKLNTLTVRGHNNRAMAAPTNTVRREAFRQRCPCATGPVVAGDYDT